MDKDRSEIQEDRGHVDTEDSEDADYRSLEDTGGGGGGVDRTDEVNIGLTLTDSQIREVVGFAADDVTQDDAGNIGANQEDVEVNTDTTAPNGQPSNTGVQQVGNKAFFQLQGGPIKCTFSNSLVM